MAQRLTIQKIFLRFVILWALGLYTCLGLALGSPLKEVALSRILDRLSTNLRPSADPNADVGARVVLKFSSTDVSEHAVIAPSVSRNRLVYTLTVDENAFLSPVMLLKPLLLLEIATEQQALSKRDLPYSSDGAAMLAEILTNAKAGSPYSQLWMVQTHIKNLKTLKINENSMPDLKILFGASSSAEIEMLVADYAKKEIARLNPIAEDLRAKYRESTTAALAQVKTSTTDEEYQALDRLVQKNDRTGARRWLEAKIPWTLLEPTEAVQWKKWLETIENPSAENIRYAFRGIESANPKPTSLYSSEFLQQRRAGKNPFLSLIEAKEKSLTTRARFSKPQTVSNSFHRHSSNSERSHFISLTADLGVAHYFSKGTNAGVVFVQMDEGRLIPNIYNRQESEMLAPFIIFPDEIISVVPNGPNASDQKEKLIKDLEKKFGPNVGHAPEDESFESAALQFTKKTLFSTKSCLHFLK